MRLVQSFIAIPYVILPPEITGVTESEAPVRRVSFTLNFHLGINGVSLTHDELNHSYAIIRHNIRTYRSAGVVEVIRGKRNAESALQKLEACQHSLDHFEGWRYFLEATDLHAGTNAAEATQQRQADLEKREAKAMLDVNTPIIPFRTSDTEH